MKNLISNRLLALGIIASLSFAACQKAETESNLMQSNKEDAEMNVVGSAAKPVAINGLISEGSAAKMQATYKKNYKGKNFTEYVEFDIKDMEEFIKQLKKKYKSDKLYVYFGEYDKTTAPKSNYEGRVSVFFLGNNKKTNSGNFRSQAVDDGTPTEGSNYLNHGTIWP